MTTPDSQNNQNSPVNPYEVPLSAEFGVPASALNDGQRHGEGSLETGTAGQYSFRVFDVISEGFKLSNGHKLSINLAVLIMSIISIVASFIPFASWLIGGAFSLGMSWMGVRAAVGRRTEVGQIFDGFKLFGPLLGLYLLVLLLTMLGFLLLIIPGIYLSVAYMFALLVRYDKGIPVWDAMEASRKAITHNWFSFLGLIIMLGLINMIGLVLMIGWIWTLPASLVTLGVVYRKVFGVEAKIG